MLSFNPALFEATRDDGVVVRVPGNRGWMMRLLWKRRGEIVSHRELLALIAEGFGRDLYEKRGEWPDALGVKNSISLLRKLTGANIQSVAGKGYTLAGEFDDACPECGKPY